MNDLRIVGTLDELQSITTGYGKSSSLKYQATSQAKSKCLYIPKETNETEMDWSYLLARTYLQTFEPRTQRCSTEIYC